MTDNLQLTWRELAILADWHDVQAVEADAMDFSQCVPYHEQRAKTFRQLSGALKLQADGSPASGGTDAVR